jgi:hypothetical protein
LGGDGGADLGQDGVHVQPDFFISDPEDRDADGFESGLATFICLLPLGQIMDVSVQLDGEAYFGRVEI